MTATRCLRGAIVVVAIWVLATAGAALAATPPAFSNPRALAKPLRAAAVPGLDSAVARIASAARTSGAPAALDVARSAGLEVRGSLVHVIVQSGSPDDGAAAAAVVSVGGHVEGTYAGLVSASVPTTSLRSLATSASVALVRRPFGRVAETVSGEEVGASGAAALQSAGITGAGAKVAIIDLGFGGLAAKQASGEVPANAVVVDDCPTDGIGNEVHGTAVAEIVHEMAPAAQLYLICIDDEVSLGQAEAYAKQNGIKIVTHSVGWFNTSRGDGTGGAGTPDAIVADAAANGILWFNSAGNEAQSHWSGNFVNDGNGFHQFAPGDNTNGFFIPGGGTACVFLKWDGWPSTTQDFDLRLYASSGFDPVAVSENDQTAGGEPTESLCYTNPSATTATYYAAIVDFQASASPRFDLFVTGNVGALQFDVPSGSLVEPASSQSAFAVGAVCWQNNSLEGFSSQGPTIDGRTKPDLAGQDGESSATYGNANGQCSGFTGTSASAPAAAGAAALLLSENPTWTAAQLAASLRQQALDVGAAGPDNLFGAGVLHLSPAAARFQVSAPATAPSGASISVTVKALDASNALVPGYAGKVHFSSSDGIAVLPADYTFVAGDAGVHTFSVTLKTSGAQGVTATDTARSSVTGQTSVDVTTPDVTAPTIQVTTPADGAQYARGSSVLASYTCSDTGGSGIASCTGTAAVVTAIDTGTLGQKAFTVDALDNAGNETTKTVHYTVVDSTKPTVTVATPADGAFYKQNASVTASYSCADETGGSGLASCSGPVASGAAISTSAEGAHPFTVTATDVAGNVASKTVNYTVDGTAPTATITAPADHAFYKLNQVVNAAYTCADTGGSGVATCAGTSAVGAAIETSTVGLHTFTLHTVDVVGNVEDVSVQYTVDGTAPTVTVTTPTEGAIYELGLAVTTDFACDDAALDSCKGNGADSGGSLDTSSVGDHTFTVVADDKAKNETTVVRHYSIVKTADNAAVNPGASLSTGATSTSKDPVQASVTTPTGGTVDIRIAAATTTAPNGYSLAGIQANLTAPTETAANPLVLVFTLDGTLIPQGQTKDTVAVFRDGTLVPPCTDTTGKAVPDACVKSRALSGDDVVLTVLSSHASAWNFGFAQPAGGGGGGGGGGGSGGGGGGGVPPDLHVTLTANAATPPPVGSELIYSVKVSVKNVGSASDVRLNMTLPAGFTVTHTYSDRGAGCTGTAPTLVCDVAWITPSTGTNVTIWGTVGQAGELDATATVTTLVEKEFDASDNAVTLKLVPAAAPPPPTPTRRGPPKLKQAGGAFRPPLLAAHVGKAALVSTSVTVDEAATLKASVLRDTTHPFKLLGGSKLGAVLATTSRTQLAFAAKGARTVAMRLRIPYASLKRGRVYHVLVTAKAADGQSSRLLIQFRG